MAGHNSRSGGRRRGTLQTKRKRAPEPEAPIDEDQTPDPGEPLESNTKRVRWDGGITETPDEDEQNSESNQESDSEKVLSICAFFC